MFQQSFNTKKILLIDKDFDFLNNLKLFLEDNFFIHTASNYIKLITLIKKEDYDFIIIEMNTDLDTKNNIINSIRKIDSHVKIILMINVLYSDSEKIRDVIEKVDDFIFKPFDVNLLNQKLIDL